MLITLFAVSHRNHASVSEIKNYLPSYAGLLVEREVENLHKILKPNKPLVVVIGGSKISTKLPLLEKLTKIADYVLLGGGLANTFLAMLEHEIGRSISERENIDLLNKLYHFYRKTGNKKIILPVDLATTKNKNGSGKTVIKNIANISSQDYIYDIGPRTISFYSKFIKKANTIIWNGPLGFYEKKAFKHGTIAIGRHIANRASGKAFAVVGGGETNDALEKTGMMHDVDWVSTGGGAMLSYLGGEKMPGLKGLVE